MAVLEAECRAKEQQREEAQRIYELKGL